ncbi:MAG: major capsid protein [bacterium]
MWTLAELSKIETDVLRKSVIDTLLFESNLMEMVPWETIGQLSTGVIRIQDLPSVGYRRINGAYDSTDIGHFEHAVENIALFGRDIDTDEAIARAKNTVADARAIQQMLVLKAMAYDFNNGFINNEVNATTPLVYNGLRKRVNDVAAEGYTSQKIDAACGGVGILNTSATSQAFLDKLNKLMFSIKGHKPDYLLMNDDMYLALFSLLRREKLLDTTRDMFDREIDTYRGARLIDIGVKADQTTKIITSTEASTGAEGSSEHTSIYAVKFGVGDMTWGIQQFPMEVKDMGELEEKPAYRTRITWNLGLATVDPRSVGRLYGIIPDASS